MPRPRLSEAVNVDPESDALSSAPTGGVAANSTVTRFSLRR